MTKDEVLAQLQADANYVLPEDATDEDKQAFNEAKTELAAKAEEAKVEEKAKSIAEKILNYTKVKEDHELKMKQINADHAKGNAHLVDEETKLFSLSRGKSISIKKSQATVVAEWFKSFLDWKVGNKPDAYFKMLQYRAKLEPIRSDVAAEGGDLVPTILYNMIVPLIEDEAVIRPNSTIIDMTTTRTLDIPTMASKPVVTINGEAVAKGTTSMTFGKFTLTPYTLAGIVPVTQEMLDYSPFEVVKLVVAAFAGAISKAEDKLFTTGSGTNEPTGLEAYTPAYTLALGGAALTFRHLQDIYFRLTQSYRKKGVWMMSSKAMAIVSSMVDSQQRPIFDMNGLPNEDGLQTILRRPVYENNNLPAGTIYFGDMKAYYIGSSRQIKVDIAKEATIRTTNLFESNMIAIRVEEKIDGELSDTRAFTKITGAG